MRQAADILGLRYQTIDGGQRKDVSTA
jgi:hypothetical protein